MLTCTTSDVLLSFIFFIRFISDTTIEVRSQKWCCEVETIKFYASNEKLTLAQEISPKLYQVPVDFGRPGKSYRFCAAIFKETQIFDVYQTSQSVFLSRYVRLSHNFTLRSKNLSQLGKWSYINNLFRISCEVTFSHHQGRRVVLVTLFDGME